jgi:DnaJ-class molecular chaperone
MGNRPANTHRCPKCGGTGKVTVGAGQTTCGTCGGNGYVANS